jgi:hypothetical protein
MACFCGQRYNINADTAAGAVPSNLGVKAGSAELANARL